MTRHSSSNGYSGIVWHNKDKKKKKKQKGHCPKNSHNPAPFSGGGFSRQDNVALLTGCIV